VSTSNGKIFCIGGYNSNITLRYLILLEKLEIKAYMNTSRFYHCAIGEETLGKIFVIGGYNNGCLKSCESYDIDGDKWTNIAPLNEAK